MAQTGQQQQQPAAETAETELQAPTHLSSASSPQPTDSSSSVVEHSTNSSLLLRLFTSQFFDSWLAVSYLFRYPQMVGAQHFLCNELRKFPIEEVEFFLPQLVHLLITRPNESIAVESLLMDMSLRSSHVAMLLYWYLQAYLSDLAPNPRTPSFKHCQRIFNQVQELLFTDIAPELIIDAPEPVQYSYLYAMEHGTSRVPRPSLMAGLAERFKSMFRLTPQVRENTAAAFVGIGSSLASAAAPSLAPTMGWLAVAQGQRVKISERIDEDPDLPPQHHLLTGKGKKGVGRSSSVMVRRTVDKEADRSQKSLRNAYTGTNTPEAMDIFSKRQSQYALDADDAERMSSSQPTTPSISEHLSQEFGSDFDRTSWSATPGPSNPAAAPAIVGPAQHAFLGSRAPTPGGRVSTDSCRTVAVMENVERTRSEGAPSKAKESASINEKQGVLPRKQYLDKAAKEFQRNAKALGRKLSRPSPGMLSQASGSQQAHKASRMRANMSDMATYMEGERKKLERRTGYFGAEIKFMTALMDIAQNVCAVPKVGRQQSLKAELTLLNHSLDRNMCIPLWCPDSDGAHHHRIVRIPTEDTVVLNSAERAPYLLTLEILEPDASTDCSHSTKQSQPANAKSGLELAGAAHKESPGPPSAAVLDLDDELEVDITSLSIGRKFSEDPQAPPIAVEAAKDMVKVNREDEIPRSVAQPVLGPTAEAAAPSPQDVDEDLMAQVFGDLNDFSSNSGSTSPFSRQYSRSRSSGKGKGKSKGKGKGTDRDVSN
ncbi:Phosphatidylinositol 4-kinase pik1alpha (PI4-kinase)(PtdIns-4-kinase), partial [Linderina pennispora]